MLTVEELVAQYIATDREITLREFIIDLQNKIYPDQDINFMDYFFKLTKSEYKGQFIVPHTKLIEYGVATSDRIDHMKVRLTALGLVEGIHYIKTTVDPKSKSINAKNTRGRPSNLYMLKPDSFKLALIRAQKFDTNPIDPTMYATYYFLLEEAVNHYNVYQMEQLKLRNAKLREENVNLNVDNTKYGDVINQMFAKLNSIENKNNQLLDKAEKAEQTAEKAETARDQIVKKLDTVVDMLKEKSIVSTMNPVDTKLHHNFVVMGYKFKENDLKGRKLSFIAGQDTHVRGAIRKKFEDPDHNWTIQIGMHYNANPIDLRNNIRTRVNDHIKIIIDKENARRKRIVDKQNESIRNAISIHNKNNLKSKRSFKNEKVSIEKLNRYDIPIECLKLSLRYVENDWVPYDELINVIRDVNIETQKSPYTSDNDSDTAPTAQSESDSE